MIEYPKPPFPKQKQAMPGVTSKMEPAPDHVGAEGRRRER
jgi:hypothetical protein